MARGIDLGNFTGQVPHAVEQAILRLREGLDDAHALIEQVQGHLTGLAPGLTLEQIRAALAPTGSSPLPTAALLNTDPPPTTPQPAPDPGPGQTSPDAWGAICQDGTQVQCSSSQSNQPGSIQFGSDASIPLTLNGSYLAAVNGYAIFRATNSVAYLVTRGGVVSNLGPTYGDYCVGLTPAGTPVVQDSATTYSVGGVSHPIPGAFSGTTNGFLSVQPDGTPNWTDAQPSVVLGGQTLLLPSTDGNWTVGIATNTPQFLAWNASTGTLYYAGPTLNSPIAPRVAQQSDGSAVLARSLPVGWNGSAQFTAYQAIPTVPAGADAIPVSSIQFVFGTSIQNWTITSDLGNVTHVGTTLCTPHSKQGVWPGVPFFGDASALVEGQQWLFAFIGGQWYGGADEYLRSPAQICKDVSGFLGDNFGGTPMASWSPVPGEQVGVCVSCPARGGQWSLTERSQIKLINW